MTGIVAFRDGYSVGGAMPIGRALEELGYAWFEEPVQHYHVAAMASSLPATSRGPTRSPKRAIAHGDWSLRG